MPYTSFQHNLHSDFLHLQPKRRRMRIIFQHNTRITYYEVRFWYLVCTELISSVVSLSFDLGHRRLSTCPFSYPSRRSISDAFRIQVVSSSDVSHPSSLLGPSVSSMWESTICMPWPLPSEYMDGFTNWRFYKNEKDKRECSSCLRVLLSFHQYL